jgi:hypothetical protein
MTIATSYEQVTYNSPDGAQVGKSSTEKVGFFGATPVVRPSVTWPNTGTATTTLNETKVNRIMAALVTLGLIVTT